LDLPHEIKLKMGDGVPRKNQGNLDTVRPTTQNSTRATTFVGLIVAATLCTSTVVTSVRADLPGDPTVKSRQDGETRDKDGNPTFDIARDGTVDWYSYDGYLRYTANCMQCHGPDGLGSSLAPSLTDALKGMDYNEFVSTVASGKRDVNAAQDLVMPAFGTNRNVMCYIDPIYVYLRARSDGAIGRGRPQKFQPKPAPFAQAENSCMG
jgi:methanol metabolism-related c-type cytochrome